MALFLWGLAVLAAGGILALLTTRAERLANFLGAASAIVGCGLALAPVVETVASGAGPTTLVRAWDVPYGSFTIGLDPLSAWFALPILGLSGLVAIYAAGYLPQYAGRKSLGGAWFFYNLMVAAMAIVVTAGNGVLFLVAWEVMVVASYFLVVFDDEQPSVRDAGRVYLIASHLGTAFLLVFFVLLGQQAGTLDFAGIHSWLANTEGFAPQLASLLFVLAIVGFGTKAGFMPFHVWLPKAYSVAPGYVAAIMSGAMVKTAIYGLLRTLSMLGPPAGWWGWLLIGIGVVSGIVGALYAVTQSDLKRLLAFSSVENLGIIALGLGIGLLGITLNEPGAAVLGFGGALVHVLNHALFKDFLFLGAGAVVNGTGTADIEHLGGLIKRMPLVGTTFMVGSVAICGLPPLNGFISEFLIYLGAFEEEALTGAAGGIPALLVIGGLALSGGLAMAAFTKGFGLVFLGEPRSEEARHAQPSGFLMQLPIVILAAGCLVVTLAAVPIVERLTPVLGVVLDESQIAAEEQLAEGVIALDGVVTLSVIVIVVAAGLSLLRLWLLSSREVGASPTWGCGYAKPTTRMQYTSTSFAHPLTQFFAPLLQTRVKFLAPRGWFPLASSLETETPDIALERGYRPLFRGVNWLLSWLSWMQHGRVSGYILYIAVTMVTLLVWFVVKQS